MENSVVEWAWGTRSSASLIVHTNARHLPSLGKTNRQPSGGNWRPISLYTACIMNLHTQNMVALARVGPCSLIRGVIGLYYMHALSIMIIAYGACLCMRIILTDYQQ